MARKPKTEPPRHMRALLPFLAADGNVFNPSVTVPADHPAVRAHPTHFVSADISELEFRELQAAAMAEDSRAAVQSVKAQMAEMERVQREEAKRFHQEARENWERSQRRRNRPGTDVVMQTGIALGAIHPDVALAKSIAAELDRRDVE